MRTIRFLTDCVFLNASWQDEQNSSCSMCLIAFTPTVINHILEIHSSFSRVFWKFKYFTFLVSAWKIAPSWIVLRTETCVDCIQSSNSILT